MTFDRFSIAGSGYASEIFVLLSLCCYLETFLIDGLSALQPKECTSVGYDISNFVSLFLNHRVLTAYKLSCSFNGKL